VHSQDWNKERDTETKLGDRVINYLIGKYVKIRYRTWMLRKEINESKLNLQDLSRMCSEHVLPVTSPLALIAQIQDSGGTLLGQLLDGHPELHVHPHELMIGYPEKGIWPRIDLSEYNREGYKKEKEDKETFPFIFIPSLQREIFLKHLDSVQFITLRDVFDAYMLSNQNYNGPKKFVTAYTPRLAMIKENMGSFFEVYPDGRFIFVVRDPKSWFPSAKKRWPGSYTDVGQALSEWNKSAQAMLWNKEKYGDCVCLIKFEDLIRKTEAAMRFLAEFLGIEFDDILLTPTFNKFPVKGNTSFKVKDQGTLNSLLSTEKTLTEHEVDTIEKETGEIYSLVRRESVRFE
jgi:hypothetical protein